MERPSFGRRLLLVPLLPPLWTEAAAWRFRDVLWPLLVWMAIVYGLLAGYRSWEVRTEVRRWVEQYDASNPAVVVEDGRVRVEGDAVIRFDEDDATFLVDPKETIPLESITSAEYIVVRETQIILKRSLRRDQVMEISDLQRLLSADPLRIDGESLRSFDNRWGTRGAAAAGVFLLLFAGCQEGLALLVYVPIAAGIACARARTRNPAIGYAPCVRVALAAYSPLVLLDVVLSLAGASPGFCAGVLVWPLLLAVLATWKARDVRPLVPVAQVFE
jgi:hypothetical protein